MIAPEYPSNEFQRQKEVEKYNLLDSLPEDSFDSITSIMAFICETPISLVTLLDKERNFLVSHHGIELNEDPRERSFCGHAILSAQDIMIVSDAAKDERFKNNPLVTEMGVRFYAGAPLINSNGYKLGTLCVYDMKPKELNEHQIQALKNMSRQVMLVMESQYQNILLKKAQVELQQRNTDLKKFAAIVSHDLKSPLASIYSLTNVIESILDKKQDEEALEWLDMIKKSSYSLTKYIDGILAFYYTDELVNSGKVKIKLGELKFQLQNLYATETEVTISIHTELLELWINQGALMQILINLITNGLKYNSKENRTIDITISEDDHHYYFNVKDNGNGIESSKDVFELFETNNQLDRDGKTGIGIGLATVKKIVNNLSGEIDFESVPQKGTTFRFSFAK